MSLSNLPPKGTADWFPEELKIRKYIFDTWRKVSLSFGYKEYLTPIVESAEVYRAKSGEDIGGRELMSFFDKGGRELAIRPEMTPSVTRMVSRIYENSPKPLRLFSIANFVRNEKPQRGRNREFWQLNADIFGADSVNADIEILQLALEIMKSFRAPEGSFTVFINNRQLLEDVFQLILDQNAEAILDERDLALAALKQNIVRLMDKYEKLDSDVFRTMLKEMNLSDNASESIIRFLKIKDIDEFAQSFPQLSDSKGFQDIKFIIDKLTSLGYAEWIKFQPSVIRGFDYYDGMVFEVFDNNPENSRSMFGGGRYNGLASLFGGNSFPATGFAPGDETTKLFLEAWNLIPEELLQSEDYYLPMIDESLSSEYDLLAQKLRSEGKNIIQSTDIQKVGKALDYANKTGIANVILLGSEEKSRNIYKVKNMKSGEEGEVSL